MRALTGLSTAAFILVLPACAADTANYPSLARRPAERAASNTPTAAPAPVATAPDAELPARLAALIEQAREADTRFASRRAEAERAVAAGGGAAPGSEAWAVASVALASLESARSDAMIALADLDQLYAAARIASSGEWATIAAARDQVTAWIGEEDRILAALRGRLGG